MRITNLCLVCMLALLVIAGNARADLELSISFDRDEAMSSEFVGVEILAANHGEDAVLADFGITVGYGEFGIGPVGGKLRLPAETGYQVEHDVYLVPIPAAGDLSITLTLAAGGEELSATATLSVTPGPPGQRPTDDAGGIVEGLMDALLASGAVETAAPSFASVKADFSD